MKKRIFAAIASALLLVSLCSCGGKKEEKVETPEIKEPITYENPLSSENNKMFLVKNYDENFFHAFAEAYFTAKNVPLDKDLQGAAFKIATVSDSENVTPEVARKVVEDAFNSVMLEEPTSYKITVEKLEKSYRIRIHYSFNSMIEAEDLFE